MTQPCLFIRKKPKTAVYEYGFYPVGSNEPVVMGEALSSEEALRLNSMAPKGSPNIPGNGTPDYYLKRGGGM